MKRARRSCFDFLRHRIGQGVGRGAFDRRIGEAADAVELRFFEEVEQLLELGFGLAGKADDEGAADGEVGADLAPVRGCARSVFSAFAGRFISFRMRGLACWNGTSR